MFRLTIPLVAGIFVSDHFFQGALPVLVSGTGILGCLIGLIVLMKWQGYLSRWLFGGMVFMFLFCVGALLLQQKWQRVDYEWSSGKNMYQGVIVDVPQEKAKTYLCKLRIDKEMSERGIVPVNRMILVYIMKDSLSVNLRCGDHLNFYTRISTPEREVIPGEFDYAAYLFRQQISGTAVIFPGYWQWTGKKSALTWKQRTGVWREKILNSYRKWGFSGDEFAVLSALTVGYKEELSEDLRETYQVAGVSHILALSGMHIAVLWGLLCWILRPLDRSCLLRWVKCGIIVLLLWTFAFLVGLPPSVIRAVVIVPDEKTAERAYLILREILAEKDFDCEKRLSWLNRDSSSFKKGLTVTTFYLAKGLEFDQVFSIFPKDEKREMMMQAQYIAATRALHELRVYHI